MFDPVPAGRAPLPPDPLAADLAALGLRIEEAREASDPAPDHPVLLLDLENAFEELRVAGAEIRGQQEQIDELLDDRRTERQRHELVLDVLPVPTLTTDPHGTIRGANAAAAGLLGRSVPRLLGKPLPALFDLGDRPGVRDLLTALVRGADVAPVHATTWSPAGAPRGRDLVVSALPSPSPLVVWMLLEQREGTADLTLTRPQLATVLTRLAGLTAAIDDRQEALDVAATLSRDALGTGVEVTVSTGPPDHPTALASTSVVAQRFDGDQLRLGQGPAVDAFALGRTVTTGDLQSDERWPELAQVPGVPTSAVSTPLETAGERVGVLTVLASAPGTPRALVNTVEVLAATIGAVLYELDLKAELRATARDLQRALESRAVIDQAKGIVMADRGCDADEAFAHLVRVSREQEVKVRDLAQLLVQRRSGRA